MANTPAKAMAIVSDEHEKMERLEAAEVLMTAARSCEAAAAALKVRAERAGAKSLQGVYLVTNERAIEALACAKSLRRQARYEQMESNTPSDRCVKCGARLDYETAQVNDRCKVCEPLDSSPQVRSGLRHIFSK